MIRQSTEIRLKSEPAKNWPAQSDNDYLVKPAYMTGDFFAVVVQMLS